MDAQVEKQSDMQGIACRNCGAEMKYDPQRGCLHCDYCDSDQTIEAKQGEVKKGNFSETFKQASAGWGTQTVSVRCTNCGAQVILEADKTADFCVFCGSPAIERLDSNTELAPGYVIPFKITETQAADSFKNWVRHRAFAPRKLKRNAQMQKLRGVYIPHYAFDCDTSSSYTARAGSDDDNLNDVSGDLYRECKNIVVPASTHINKQIEGNFNFMLGDLVKYTPEYLAGFLAEKVSVKPDDGFSDARKEIDRQIKSSVESKIKQETNASVVSGISVTTHCSNIKSAVLLLPIWLSVYTVGAKKYEFMINGQSGHVKGKSPLSALKIMLYLAVTGGVFFLLYHVIAYFAFVVLIIMLCGMWGVISGNAD